MPKKYFILLLLLTLGTAGLAAWQYYSRRTPPSETIATLQARLNSYVDLYKALGGGWISAEEKKAAEQAAAEQNQN